MQNTQHNQNGGRNYNVIVNFFFHYKTFGHTHMRHKNNSNNNKTIKNNVHDVCSMFSLKFCFGRSTFLFFLSCVFFLFSPISLQRMSDWNCRQWSCFVALVLFLFYFFLAFGQLFKVQVCKIAAKKTKAATATTKTCHNHNNTCP